MTESQVNALAQIKLGVATKINKNTLKALEVKGYISVSKIGKAKILKAGTKALTAHQLAA